MGTKKGDKKKTKKEKKEEFQKEITETVNHIIKNIESQDFIDMTALVSGSYAFYKGVNILPQLLQSLVGGGPGVRELQKGLSMVAFGGAGAIANLTGTTDVFLDVEENLKEAWRFFANPTRDPKLDPGFDWTHDYTQFLTEAERYKGSSDPEDLNKYNHFVRLYNQYSKADIKLQKEAKQLLIAVAVFSTCMFINISREISIPKIVQDLVVPF